MFAIKVRKKFHTTLYDKTISAVTRQKAISRYP